MNFGLGFSRPDSNAADELWSALLEQRKMLMERKSQLQTTLSVLDSEEMEIRGGSAECLDDVPLISTIAYPAPNEPLPFDVVS